MNFQAALVTLCLGFAGAALATTVAVSGLDGSLDVDYRFGFGRVGFRSHGLAPERESKTIVDYGHSIVNVIAAEAEEREEEDVSEPPTAEMERLKLELKAMTESRRLACVGWDAAIEERERLQREVERLRFELEYAISTRATVETLARGLGEDVKRLLGERPTPSPPCR